MKKSRSKALRERKEARTQCPDTIGTAAYNGIIGLTILYGFVVNALMVLFARPFFESLPVAAVLIGYLVSAFAGALPFLLAAAGGAMLYVISDEMIPESHAHGFEKPATFALIAGVLLVLSLQNLF